MSGSDNRSADLEQVRVLLFPQLTPAEGWRHIDAAFERAADGERAARVERLAEELDLEGELLRSIRRLRPDELL